MRKGGKYVYTLVPITNSLTPLSPSHNSEPTQNLYPQIRITDTPRSSSPIPFIERFIVRCENKNDIYRADDSKRAYTMIVVNSITVTMFRRDV